MLIVKCFRYFSKIFKNKHNVSMKSWRGFLHLSSFSDSNSFMTAGPGLDNKDRSSAEQDKPHKD